MKNQVDKGFNFDAAVDSAWAAFDTIPRKEFCALAEISERTFDRNSDIIKLRRGRRVFSTRQCLDHLLAIRDARCFGSRSQAQRQLTDYRIRICAMHEHVRGKPAPSELPKQIRRFQSPDGGAR